MFFFFFSTSRPFNDLVPLLPKSGPFVACFLLRWLAKAHFRAAAEVKSLANGSLSGEYEGEEISTKDYGSGSWEDGEKEKKKVGRGHCPPAYVGGTWVTAGGYVWKGM